MMTINFIDLIDFLCQIKILLRNILKLFKIQGFSGFLIEISGFSRLKKNLKFKIFQRFQVKWQP